METSTAACPVAQPADSDKNSCTRYTKNLNPPANIDFNIALSEKVAERLVSTFVGAQIHASDAGFVLLVCMY